MLDLQNFDKNYIHAKNIQKKYNDGKHLDFIRACVKQYEKFDKSFNDGDLNEKVKAWNEYLAFVRKNNENNKFFTPQSKFDSTILEECVFRLFKDLCSEKIKVGNTKAYSNLYFSPINFDDFKTSDKIKINTKDQDFAIYKDVNLTLENGDKVQMSVPVVAFECKTYLDKTMLESSVATAEKIKAGNPSCRFCIITERYSVDKEVDIKSTRIDQIYVLKKDATKEKQKDKIIAIDVVERLVKDTEDFLKRNWSSVEENIRDYGVVL